MKKELGVELPINEITRNDMMSQLSMSNQATTSAHVSL